MFEENLGKHGEIIFHILYLIVHHVIRYPCSYLSLVSEFSVLLCSLGRDHELQFQSGLAIGDLSTDPANGK